MNTFFVDAGSGVAGDMLLGAWIELGLSARELEKVLKNVLKKSDWHLEIKHTERAQWPSRTLRVVGDRPFGGPKEMRSAIKRSALHPTVKSRATRIINTLAWAEGQAHRHPGEVTFDDQGLALMDTMVDVVGNSWALWKLGIENVQSSPVHVGRIAPATARIVQRFNIPIEGKNFAYELATPTGMAIIAEIATSFGAMPAGQLIASGYGAGQREIPGRPNVLAIYKLVSDEKVGIPQKVVELTTLIDDMDPRLYPHVAQILLDQGALDVWWIPVGMKKGRPGLSFTVLCHAEKQEVLLKTLFNETTTLGVRVLPLERRILARVEQGLLKKAKLPNGTSKVSLEFEVARREAARRDVPLRTLLK